MAGISRFRDSVIMKSWIIHLMISGFREYQDSKIYLWLQDDGIQWFIDCIISGYLKSYNHEIMKSWNHEIMKSWNHEITKSHNHRIGLPPYLWLSCTRWKQTSSQTLDDMPECSFNFFLRYTAITEQQSATRGRAQIISWQRAGQDF